MRRLAFVVVVATLSGNSAFAQTAVPGNDYSKPEAWLCRPGLNAAQDACAVDLTTTVVTEDGRLNARSVYGAPQPADRLLLRLSHRVARSHGQQRHDGWDGRTQRHPLAVCALRVAMSTLCAALPADHPDVSPGDHGRQADRQRPRARVHRCPRRVEPLPEERQSGTRRGVDWSLAGLWRFERVDSSRDRRQTDSVEDRLGAPPWHQRRGS